MRGGNGAILSAPKKSFKDDFRKQMNIYPRGKKYDIAFFNLTTTTKHGGIETFNWEMARVLAERGHTTHVYGGASDGPFPFSERVYVHLFPYIARERFPDLGSRFRKFAERISFGKHALPELRRSRHDYIYVSKPFDIPVALLAARGTGTKVIFGSGGTEFFPGYRSLVRRLDYFFACSRFNATQIQNYSGIRPLVLYNGINTERFLPTPPEHGLRASLGIREEEIVIVTVCRLVGWKGVKYSIEAVSKLADNGYPIRYLVIGDGEDRPALQDLAVRLGRREEILFLGRVSNMLIPKYYSIATMAIFPSVADETFGISIAEAMACGVSVISTKIGGIPEVVKEGVGILVSPRDSDALAQAAKRIIDDQDLRGKLGESGRRYVLECFRWEKIVSDFENYIG